MGNDSSSHTKEKKQDFSITCLQDIYKFRLEKICNNNNISNHIVNSEKFLLKTPSKLNNPMQFILFAETLLSQTDLLFSNKQVGLSLYHTSIFPEICIDSYDSTKIKTNKGDEDFFLIMNQFVHGYTENNDHMFPKTSHKGLNIENFEKVLINDSFVYNNLQTSVIEENSKEIKEFPFSQEFDLEDYIKKESEKVKKNFTFKESYVKEENYNSPKNIVEEEREFDILKNKYLEQSLKIKRKSVVSGENQVLSKQFMSSYRTQNSKKPEFTKQGSSKLLYPQVKQNVKLQVKNPVRSMVSTKNSNGHFKHHQFANIRTYEEIMNETKNVDCKPKIVNRSSSKINGLSKNNHQNMISNGSVYSPTNKSKNLSKAFQNKSVSKYNEMKKQSGGLSLRIDVRKLMDDDLFKEETNL